MICGEEVAGELVEPSCDAPPVFDAAKVIFDPVAASVDAPGTPGFACGIVTAGDHGQRTIIADLLSHVFAVVCLVGGHRQCRLRRIKQHLDNLAVMHLATSKQEVQRPSFAVNTGMDLGGPATTADFDVLRFLPPLWNGPPLNSTLIGLGNRRAI